MKKSIILIFSSLVLFLSAGSAMAQSIDAQDGIITPQWIPCPVWQGDHIAENTMVEQVSQVVYPPHQGVVYNDDGSVRVVDCYYINIYNRTKHYCDCLTYYYYGSDVYSHTDHSVDHD